MMLQIDINRLSFACCIDNMPPLDLRVSHIGALSLLLLTICRAELYHTGDDPMPTSFHAMPLDQLQGSSFQSEEANGPR